jgi:peptidyl-prolyl cis-trans isomerase D
MLKTMRKNVKALAPTLWIVIATFVISIFAIWGGAGRLGEGRKEQTVAFMGKDHISTEAYYTALRNRLEALKKEFSGLNKAFIQQLNLPQQVLEQMIQQNLLRRKAAEMGVTASNQEVRDRIVTLFQRDGKFIGFNEYRRILEYNRISLSEYENGLKQEISLNKMIQLLTAGITATPEELWENYRKQNESAKIEYLLLEESKVPVAETPAAADIRAYFEKNKDKYSLPERREGLYIFLQTEDLKKEVQVSDADIEKYYKDTLDQFKEPEKIRVSRIFLSTAGKDKAAIRKDAQVLLDRLSGGSDFAQLARVSSQDEKAKDGGDWGTEEWRNLSDKEGQEISKLSPGQMSGVVETDEGYSIFKVSEKEPEKTQTLEDVKTRIKSTLEDQKAREIAEQRIGQIEKAASREKSLDAAAQKMGLKALSTGLLKKGQGLEPFDPSGSLSQALFELKEKQVSPPVYTFSGTGIVEMEKVEAPRPAAFEEASPDVEKDLRANQQKEGTLQKIREARAQVEGKNWDEIAPKLGLEFKSVAEHKKEQYLGVIGESPEIDKLAFSLPIGQTSEPVEFTIGYALVKVLERKEASREEFEKNKATELQNFLEARKNRFLQAYIDKLRAERQVRVNYGLFMQVNNDILSRYETTE